MTSLSLLRARIDLAEATDQISLALDHAQIVRIPDACISSTVTRTTSALLGPDLTDLVCMLPDGVDSVIFSVIAVGDDGDQVSGEAVATSGLLDREISLPARTISGGTPTLSPDLRLLSSPDFLNNDVGDLAEGPGSWSEQDPLTRTINSTNAAYETALDTILDDWQDLDPAGVLVAGDLVDGRWGYDDHDSGNFGPVDTRAERRAAVRRAARTYYPQWKQRFTDRGLAVFPAMGDHEYGDDPWPRRKRLLAEDFKAEFAREFTTNAAGRPLLADHPRGPARLTAYAGRPSPDVQVVTLDVFDITPARAKIRVDRQQMRWLRDVLRKARRDDVRWVIVQAHTPILYPVRTRASSRLHYPRGEDSKLWKVFKRFGVDLYLAGEVHDTTAVQSDGIVQISHGGIFHYSLTTALLLDFYGDHLYVTLRDYDVQHSEDPIGRRLWETRRDGLPFQVDVSETVSTIGTAVIADRSARPLVAGSGILVLSPGAD
ncbi:MAG: metallophosphoesterase [Nocardioides sp.]